MTSLLAGDIRLRLYVTTVRWRGLATWSALRRQLRLRAVPTCRLSSWSSVWRGPRDLAVPAVIAIKVLH